MVDTDVEKICLLQDRFDLRTLVGNASHPSILEQAGIADVDMLLAVTQSDEVNMVACKLAASSDSTGGGIKMIRTLIVIKQAEYVFLKLLHPAAISPLKNWQPRGVRQYCAFGISLYRYFIS